MKKAQFISCLSKFNSFFANKHKAELVWGLMLYPSPHTNFRNLGRNFKLAIFFFFMVIGMGMGGECRGATLYISPVGTDNTNCGTISDPCATFSYLFASRMFGGDTLIVEDGIYSGQKITYPPSGSVGAYTIIRAANDGMAVIIDTASGDMLRINGDYIQVEGLKFVGNSPTGEASGAFLLAGSHHNKIMRCGFVTTPTITSNNVANITISGSYNLFEDCWAWGSGRYKFIIYGGDALDSGSHNILRRCVARHDRAFSGGFNPQASFCNYQGANNLFQNCLIIDSDQTSYYDNSLRGPFFLEKGQKSGSVTIDGSISINNAGTWISDSASGEDSDLMYTAGNIYVKNSFVHGTSQGFMGSYWYRTVARTALSTDHCTIANITGVTNFEQVDVGSGVAGGVNADSEMATVTNTILTGVARNAYGHGDALYNCQGNNDYNSFYNNYNNRNRSTVGAHDITDIDPHASSLLYPVRIESASPLKGAGGNGTDIGATIAKKIGVSRTLYGEPGYDTLTSENLWPWPNEDRIKIDMSSYPPNWPQDNLPTPVRGFTMGSSLDGSPQTLTKYIWEYLGNQIPADIYGDSGDEVAPAIPSDLSVR